VCSALALGDLAASPIKAATQWVILAMADIPIGAAGAVGTIDGDTGITAVNAGTGLFTLGFPPCLKVRLNAFLKSAAATVTEAIVTAASATAGTATLRTSKAGTAVNPANGDVITLYVFGQTR
jgi:hypothetical protein